MLVYIGKATQLVYDTGILLMEKMKRLLTVEDHRNPRFHVSPIMLCLLIQYRANHVFSRVGEAKVVEKFLFSSIPVMICTTKMLYAEILICYGYVCDVMPSVVIESL